MIRKLKGLGPTLVAVLALGAVGASAAPAAEFHSTSAGSTALSGVQTTTHVFTSTAGENTCEKATLTGAQVTATAASIDVVPTYSGCHLIVFGSTISSTANTNGCQYKVYSSESADIVCPAGKNVVISGAGCTITIGPQTGLKSVTFTNSGSNISMSANLSGIKYSHSGFTCGTGSGSNGTYNGTTLVSGKTTGGSAVIISYS